MRQIMSRCLTVLILAASLAAPVRAEEKIDSGAYLAARIAETENDFRAAATWFAKAIIANSQIPGFWTVRSWRKSASVTLPLPPKPPVCARAWKATPASWQRLR